MSSLKLNHAKTLVAEGEVALQKSLAAEHADPPRKDEADKYGERGVVKLGVAVALALIEIADALDDIAQHMPAAPR